MLENKERQDADNFLKKTGLYALGLYLWEFVKIILVSLAIIIPVRYFLIQPFIVRGASMEPNFYDREYLIIDEISYRFKDFSRGDVIVFRFPQDPSQFFIKRIIGLPHEAVEIKNGNVIIYNEKFPQGAQLNEASYLPLGTYTAPEVKVDLKENEYFVLGDNRDESLDSRAFGVLPKKLIVGKAWLRVFPFSDWAVFHTPETGFLAI